ncbi:MAG: hypothetical protein NC923_04515 [Candidatus Omnitrophica bacterium]|nr:hypothetical protein [Candidatus Omnitrophota bacterium]
MGVCSRTSGQRISFGQVSLEYAVVIASIIMALLLMHNYIRRSFMGYFRSRVDELGQPYDYYNVSGSHNINLQSKTTTIMRTISEAAYGYNFTTMQPCGGSVFCSDEVYATEINTTLNKMMQKEEWNETIVP